MASFARSADEVPQHQHNSDRMRRAETWHARSEKATSPAERFIFLWIAFNAAYGSEVMTSDPAARRREREKFERFLQEIAKRDHERELEKIVVHRFPGLIRSLLENQYVFQPFWSAVQGSSGRTDWSRRFKGENREAVRALESGNLPTILRIVFLRLYTLRNQIFHGGATFGTGWGRDQVRDGSQIMASLVPVILKVMRRDIENAPESDVWGKVQYPRINYDPE